MCVCACYGDDVSLQDARIDNEPISNHDDDYADGYYNVKHEQSDPDISMGFGDASYMADSFGSYGDEYAGADDAEDAETRDNGGDESNYDDLVEESLLDVST